MKTNYQTPITRGKIFCAYITVGLLAVLLTACASNTQQILADDQMAQHLLHDYPPVGFTRLYLFDGRIVDGDSEGLFAAHFRADELIDGIAVGGLNGADVLILDVPAGKHALIWRERSAKAPASKPLDVNLRAGERVFISNDYHHHAEFNSATAPLMLFGAIGGAVAGAINTAAEDSTQPAEPPAFMTIRSNGENMIEGYTVVLPNPTAVEKLQKHG